jgi:hypothetical protein
MLICRGAKDTTRQTHVNFAKIFAKRIQFERFVSTTPTNRTDKQRVLQCKLDINECNKKYSRDRMITPPCKLGLRYFWDFKRRRMVVSYRSFGTTYRSHLQDSRNLRIKQLVSADEKRAEGTSVTSCLEHGR